jgi:hypothetical protein
MGPKVAEQVRATQIDTGQKYVRAGKIIIDAPAATIFTYLSDPRKHADFDGSGTVKGNVRGPDVLELDSKFGVDMHMVVNYRIKNTVKEFEQDRLIAWCHPGHHRWRYELIAINDHQTQVIETFDGSTARFPPALKLMNAYDNNEKAILKTLLRLKALVENEHSA